MANPGTGTQMTAMEYIADVVEVEGVSTALVAGVGAAFILRANGPEAVTFGALAALSKSVGNYILTGLGHYVKLGTIFGKYGAELDPNDFIATGLAIGAVTYYTTGVRGTDLYKTMAVGGVAGVLSPKLTHVIHNWVYSDGTGKKNSASQAN